MGYRQYTPINEIHENTKVKKIKQRLEYLAGRLYSKAKSNVNNHPITSEIANFQHHEDDKIETIHKKLITNNNNP